MHCPIQCFMFLVSSIIDRLDGVRLLWSLLKSPNPQVRIFEYGSKTILHRNNCLVSNSRNSKLVEEQKIAFDWQSKLFLKLSLNYLKMSINCWTIGARLFVNDSIDGFCFYFCFYFCCCNCFSNKKSESPPLPKLESACANTPYSPQ